MTVSNTTVDGQPRCTSMVKTSFPSNYPPGEPPEHGARIGRCDYPAAEGSDLCARHGCALHFTTLADEAVCPHCGLSFA